MTKTVETKKRTKSIKPKSGPHIIIFPENYDMNLQWTYNGITFTEIPEKIIGFVYCITNNMTGKKYLGKKNFYASKTRSIKKQLFKERVQSDFIFYYGSNEALKKDVEEFGEINFKREILVLCESKAEMSYQEIKYQICYDAINGDKFYNSFVGCRINRSHLKPHHFMHELKTI